MRIAWQLHGVVLFRKRNEQLGQLLDAHARAAEFVTQEELEVNKHLIIATASGVDLLAHIAKLLRQHGLDV